MAEQWYYSKGDQRSGPVSGDELRAMAADGRLSPEDLIWTEGQSSWVPAKQARGLFPAPEAPPAPPPAQAGPVPTAGAGARGTRVGRSRRRPVGRGRGGKSSGMPKWLPIAGGAIALVVVVVVIAGFKDDGVPPEGPSPQRQVQPATSRRTSPVTRQSAARGAKRPATRRPTARKSSSPASKLEARLAAAMESVKSDRDATYLLNNLLVGYEQPISRYGAGFSLGVPWGSSSYQEREAYAGPSVLPSGITLLGGHRGSGRCRLLERYESREFARVLWLRKRADKSNAPANETAQLLSVEISKWREKRAKLFAKARQNIPASLIVPFEELERQRTVNDNRVLADVRGGKALVWKSPTVRKQSRGWSRRAEDTPPPPSSSEITGTWRYESVGVGSTVYEYCIGADGRYSTSRTFRVPGSAPKVSRSRGRWTLDGNMLTLTPVALPETKCKVELKKGRPDELTINHRYSRLQYKRVAR